MGRIYIIGNSPNLNQLGFNLINFDRFENEVSIHNWVVKLFQTEEIEKLIIDISDDPITSLKIGYHVRLSLEKLRNKVLTPILFISSHSLSQIMIGSGGYHHILSTQGTHFCDFDIEMIKREVEYIEALKESEYLTGFLKQVNIQPDETVGRHSLANFWGAYALDRASNNLVLDSEADFKKSIYFKFVVASNNLSLLKDQIDKNLNQDNGDVFIKIEDKNKRILYIDDEANKGWELVLKKIFNTSSIDDFIVINEKVKDYDSFSESAKKIIENKSFDLYLVDLRLNGLDEDENLNTEDFSGMKVLKKIKTLNQGNQVIIFTASNKTWNLKALLEHGADGYYLKESPEFNISINQTIKNVRDLQLQVKGCLNRSEYLRKLYSLIDELSSDFQKKREFNIHTGNNDIRSQFEIDVMNQLSIACTLLERMNYNERIGRGEFQNLVNHSFISIYLIVEYIYKHKIELSIKKGGFHIKKFDEKKRALVPYTNPYGNAFHGFITFIIERLKFDGLTYYKKFYDFKEYRNNISHPGRKQPDTEKCLALLENLIRIIKQIN